MKMFIKMITIALIAFLITGCTPNTPATAGNNPLATNADPTSTSSNLAPTNNDPIPTDTAPSDLKYSTMYMDWPGYPTVDKLIEASTNVFEGKLIKISFHTPSFKDSSSGRTYTELYTIYEFEVSSSYKGKNVGTVRVGIPGGMEGYKVDEQYNTMVYAGIYQEKLGIPVMGGYTHLTIGETYLIVTKDLGNDFLDILSPNRFSYLPDRTNQTSNFAYQEIKDYLSKS